MLNRILGFFFANYRQGWEVVYIVESNDSKELRRKEVYPTPQERIAQARDKRMESYYKSAQHNRTAHKNKVDATESLVRYAKQIGNETGSLEQVQQDIQEIAGYVQTLAKVILKKEYVDDSISSNSNDYYEG